MLVFLHIPKVGGQSVAALLEDIYGEENVWRATRNKAHQLIDDVNKLRSFNFDASYKYKVASGHFRYNPIVKPSKYITVIRHPLDRLVSSYWHHVKHKMRFSKYKTLETFLASGDCASVSNYQCSILTSIGHPQFLEQLANKTRAEMWDYCKNIIDKYLCVGVTDKLDCFAVELQDKLCRSVKFKIRHANKTTPSDKKSIKLPLSLCRKVEFLNWLDYTLYYYIRNKY